GGEAGCEGADDGGENAWLPRGSLLGCHLRAQRIVACDGGHKRRRRLLDRLKRGGASAMERGLCENEVRGEVDVATENGLLGEEAHGPRALEGLGDELRPLSETRVLERPEHFLDERAAPGLGVDRVDDRAEELLPDVLEDDELDEKIRFDVEVVRLRKRPAKG